MPGRAEGGKPHDTPLLSPTPYSSLTAPLQAASILMPHAKVELKHRAYARQMRKAMTDAELKFWNAVRAHRLDGMSFRRQLPVAGYIVDFACPSHKIIVELDGFQHADDAAAAYDQERTRTFKELGWTVLRFWNEDILRDIDNVCLHIIRTVKEYRP